MRYGLLKKSLGSPFTSKLVKQKKLNRDSSLADRGLRAISSKGIRDFVAKHLVERDVYEWAIDVDFELR